MKHRTRRSISHICVLLLTLFVLGLSACGQNSTPTSSNPNAATPQITPQYPPNETKDTTTNIVGEYRWNNENGYMSTIFHSDMTFVGIRASNSDSTLEFCEGGVYTVSDNLVTITWDAGVVEELTYDSARRTLTVSPGNVVSSVTSNVDGPLSIAGTWEPLSDSASFRFHFNDHSYSGANSITFYHDGSYSINYNQNTHSGMYKMIHDGAAIQIDDNKSYTSPETMKCTILSEDLLLIEADPEWEPGVYYAMKRTD